MNSSKLKKSVAALLCCGLCISSGVFGAMAVKKMPEINGQTPYADGHVYWLCNTSTLEITEIDESFFTPNATPVNNKHFNYNEEAKDWLIPGGSKSGSITIGNNAASQEATLSFCAMTTGLIRWQASMSDEELQAYMENHDESDFAENGLPKDYLPQEYIDYADANPSDYTPAQLFYLSNVLVKDKLQLKVYRVMPGTNDQKGRLIFRGYVNGRGNDYNDIRDDNFTDNPSEWYNTVIPAEEDEDWNYTVKTTDEITKDMSIELGEVQPGESVKFIFRLHAPTSLKSVIEKTDPEYAGFMKASGVVLNSGSGGANSNNTGGSPNGPVYYGNDPVDEDSVVNHGYAGAVAMIDWVFYAGINLAPEVTTTTTEPTTTTTTITTSTTTTKTTTNTTTTTKPTPPVPRTGEAAIPYAYASAACGISALLIFFIAFGNVGKKKKEEEE